MTRGAAQPHADTNRPIRVLVIDDDEEDFFILQSVLKNIPGAEFAATWKASYEEAIAALESGSFDICFLDYYLGRRDGLEFLRVARAKEWFIPVVLLTGNDAMGLDTKAVSSGATDYLHKQELSAKVVERTIRYALERKRASDERRAMERRLEEAVRIESLGALAGGVAHEINNILNIVMADIGLIGQALDDSQAELQECVDSIHEAACRGAALTKKLLSYGRRDRLDFAAVDLNAAASEAINAATRAANGKLNVEFRAGSGRTTVRADTGAIKQILINLLQNSQDALSQDGVIRVSIDEYQVGTDVTTTRPWLVPGDYVNMRVVDQGCGMDEEIRRHVFEPFFTTKPVGEGSGLGLAMVYGLVKQHRGYVDVASEVGIGTTVDVFLPLLRDATPVNAVRRRSSGQAKIDGGSGTILFVEDQPALMRAGTRLLSSLGYRVLSAGNGAEGLAVMEEQEGRIDLVITDVVMPEMTGPELYEAVRDHGWKSKFLFMSGFSAADVRNGPLLDASLPLLEKPWTLDELAAQVRKTLGKSRGSGRASGDLVASTGGAGAV